MTLETLRDTIRIYGNAIKKAKKNSVMIKQNCRNPIRSLSNGAFWMGNDVSSYVNAKQNIDPLY
jgi:hypothetical protein